MMIRNLRISQSKIQKEKGRYRVFFAAIGYEDRCRHQVEQGYAQGALGFACAFDDNQVLSFSRNRSFFENEQFEIQESGDLAFSAWFKACLNKCIDPQEEGTIRIAIDISSQSRFRLATMFSVLSNYESLVNLEVDFLYSPSKFYKYTEHNAPILFCEPVLPEYAGWSEHPELPTTACVGMGIEPDKALGAIEFLDAARVWAFRPIGPDTRFASAVDRANRALLNLLPRTNVLDYPVLDPFNTLIDLSGLIQSSISEEKIVLMPLGPKIFSVICFVVANLFYPRVSVWRVSSGKFEPAVNHKAEGEVIGLRVRFMASANKVLRASV
jgi:hypothetical protein